jgi:hypothetical protein
MVPCSSRGVAYLSCRNNLLGTCPQRPRVPPPSPPPPPTPSLLPQLGRFTLRDEGKTIAIGKVLRLPKRGGAALAE